MQPSKSDKYNVKTQKSKSVRKSIYIWFLQLIPSWAPLMVGSAHRFPIGQGRVHGSPIGQGLAHGFHEIVWDPIGHLAICWGPRCREMSLPNSNNSFSFLDCFFIFIKFAIMSWIRTDFVLLIALSISWFRLFFCENMCLMPICSVILDMQYNWYIYIYIV